MKDWKESRKTSLD